MSIRIANLNNPKLTPTEILIPINRSTPVGNPWFIGSDTSAQHRTKVCELYDSYFHKMLDDASTSESLTEFYGFNVKRREFMTYIRHIYKLAKVHDIVLGCHCFPLQCHGETIQKYIEELLEGDK